MEKIRYDRCGRLKHHPEFHPNHNKPFSEEERAYLCKFYGFDGRKSMSMALGRRETAVAEEFRRLKREGLIEYYQKMWDAGPFE
jgi:hypothetical protein